MPNSFATTANLVCQSCNQSFTADLWLIVDTVERPDLLARICAGTLHAVPCPHCQATNQPDAPLLACRPDQKPTLIFVPRWGSDEDTQCQDTQQLLALLQVNLGAAWQDRWLDEADTLPALDDATSAAAAQSPDKVTWQGGLEIPPALLSILNELAQLTQLRGMPRRIELCRQALSLAHRTSNPLLWAALQVELGRSLAMNPLGGQAQNLEESIDAYQQALQVMTYNAMPVDWAVTQNNLANVYSDRIRGERTENLECAIHHYKQALLIRTQEAFPTDWAMTQNNLATA